MFMTAHIDGEKSYNFVVRHKLEERRGNKQKTLSKMFLQPFLELLLGEKRNLKVKKGHFRKNPLLQYSSFDHANITPKQKQNKRNMFNIPQNIYIVHFKY